MERTTGWHRRSWERCMEEMLPELIGRYCELSTYRVGTGRLTEGDATAAVEVGVLVGSREIRTSYEAIPVPDERGIFHGPEGPTVVVPRGVNEEMTEIKCVGEQLIEFISDRIVPASEGILQSEENVRAWLPLSEWVGLFFQEHGQVLDTRNYISRETHLRRVILAKPIDSEPRDSGRRVCPFETPEGPWIGRVLTLALGASIEDGRIIVDPASPGVGPAASYIPFIDRNDPARLLMGSNMMRQWIEPREPEAAMVRTGTEPETAAFWAGFNLLTAYMALGRETTEDGIVLSRSAVERMSYPDRIAIGDKLSNRHGQKGVVSRIVDDDQMPTLDDGTAVECVVSFIGLHTRQNTGQLFEAAASWLARDTGRPVVVPPYASPSREELSASLEALGAPHLRRLGLGRGETTEGAVLVGWVYWGATAHRAADKLRAVGVEEALQLHGEMEYTAFRNNGLYAYIAETNGPASEEEVEPTTALERLVSGSWRSDTAFLTAPVRRMRKKLSAAGIEVRADGGFGFAWDPGNGPPFPVRLRHPWASWKTLSRLPLEDGASSPRMREITRLSTRLELLMRSEAPESLVTSTTAALQSAMNAYYTELLTHADVVPRGRRRFTARAVIVPSSAGRLDEVGIPAEMAWILFGPILALEVGRAAVESRSEPASAALADALVTRWVIVHRAPTLSDTTMVAFRPRLVHHAAVELHPLVCRWMNADFDGDMVGVYLPVSPEAQTEVAERISVMGHLRRNPGLIRSLLPDNEALWGLARSRGAENIVLNVAGGLAEEPQKAVHSVEALYQEGLETARRAGATMNPLAPIWGERVPKSRSEAEELLAADGAPGFRTQRMAVVSAARGSMEQLVNLLHSRPTGEGQPSGDSAATDGLSESIGSAILDGYGREDHFRIAAAVRRQLRTLLTGLDSVAGDYNTAQRPPGYNLLARLARASDPGVVVASAGESGEVDPLQDLDARLTVGLPV